jgi:hypothetical protein
MFDLGLADGYYDARGTAIGAFAPLVLPENAQRLSYGLVETLGRDLDRMLDALRVPTGDPAGSDWHRVEDSSIRPLFANARSGDRPAFLMRRYSCAHPAPVRIVRLPARNHESTGEKIPH